MKVKTYQGVDISVNTDSGEFSASVAADRVKAPTLAALQNQIDKIQKKTKVKVAIPVSVLGQVWKPNRGYSYQGRDSWISGAGVQHCTLTGFDIKGNVQWKDDKTGKAERASRWGRNVQFVRRLTDAEIEEYINLRKAKDAAEAAYHLFEEKVRIDDVDVLVKTAMGLSADDPKEDADTLLALDEPR